MEELQIITRYLDIFPHKNRACLSRLELSSLFKKIYQDQSQIEWKEVDLITLESFDLFEKNLEGIRESYPFFLIRFSLPSERLRAFIFLDALGYLLYDESDTLIALYHPNESLNLKVRKVFSFWDEEESEEREETLSRLRSNLNLTLITPQNLDNYILKSHPVHPAYEYLSSKHKADYLRTYFMHFYGGGYTDIRPFPISWEPYFEEILSSSDSWIVGYPERNEESVGYLPYKKHWRLLIGNSAYFCRANTELTRKWYSTMMNLLDEKLELLKRNPATHSRDCAEDGNGYPIGWNELLGSIFHKVCYEYKEKIRRTLPVPLFDE